MCLGVPMQIVELRPPAHGVAELDGTRYEVNLSLIEAPALGEHVIVHAGFAIERLDLEEAAARLALFAELAALHGADSGGPSPRAGPAVATAAGQGGPLPSAARPPSPGGGRPGSPR